MGLSNKDVGGSSEKRKGFRFLIVNGVAEKAVKISYYRKRKGSGGDGKR